MNLTPIESFNSFIENLNTIGFTLSGDNSQGLFALSQYYTEAIEAHTDNSDTDPWAWRMRCLTEYNHIVYSKVFLKKGGFITADWFPYFYKVRRKGHTLNEDYEKGMVSNLAKQVYQVIENNPNIPLYQIKTYFDTDKKIKSRIETELNNLQMGLYITITGQTYKISKEGKPYGWPVTTFSTVEQALPLEFLEKARMIHEDEAFNKIKAHMLSINPDIPEKKLKKFILG